MTWRALFLGPCALSFLFACGSTPPPKSSAESNGQSDYVASTSAPEAAAAEQPESGVPSRCVTRKNACMPPIQWAEKVCGDVYPDLALYMFQDGSPWTRFYMKIGLNAVNGWGPTVGENLQQREEVLVINHRLTKDALEVEGSLGTYDVLRWNGSCVTLDVNEVTKRTPNPIEVPRIDFRALSEPMADALLRSDDVSDVHNERRKECKGATIGRVTKRCEDLDKELGRVLADYVRDTDDLPVPNFLP
jgi:hypothetical protein